MKDGLMAGKPQNRIELRRQYDAAEPLDPMEDEADDLGEGDEAEETEKKPKKKPKAAAKSKAKSTKSTKAAKPAARMRIVWKVVNDAFKEVGSFEYAQKEAAYARAAELTAKGKGTHFVQKSKEPMPDDAPGLGAAIPRAQPAAAVATKTKAKGSRVVREEVEPEEDEEAETEAAEDEEDEE
jgi:hypothetical protein